MSQILLCLKDRESVEKLRRFSTGHNREYAPVGPIELQSKFRVKLERFRRFAKGDNKDYAPISPIRLLLGFMV